MTQRILAQARVKGTRKVTEVVPGSYQVRVEGLPYFVTPSIPLYRRMYRGSFKLGEPVQLRVRHLLLDEGTPNEREYWNAYVLDDES